MKENKPGHQPYPASTSRQSFTGIALILAFVIIANSCTICEKPCVPYSTDAVFDFINKQSGQNLVFGPGRVYEVSSIKVYSIKGSDTIFHTAFAGRTPFSTPDSVVVVDFDQRRFDTAYIRLSQTDTDTIAVRYQLQEQGSCPDSYTVESIKYNGIDLHVNKELSFVIEK